MPIEAANAAGARTCSRYGLETSFPRYIIEAWPRAVGGRCNSAPARLLRAPAITCYGSLIKLCLTGWDFVDEMEADEQLILSGGQFPYDMKIENLFVEILAHSSHSGCHLRWSCSWSRGVFSGATDCGSDVGHWHINRAVHYPASGALETERFEHDAFRNICWTSAHGYVRRARRMTDP